MATSDQEQMSDAVPYHKRIAMGAKVDGSSLQSRGTQNGSKPAVPRERSSSGALSRMKTTK
jgi:hypothetical protein